MAESKTMTKGQLKRYKALKILTKCAAQNCGLQIWPGQNYISKHTYKRHGNRTRLYHEACWDSLFYETPEEQVLTQKA